MKIQYISATFAWLLLLGLTTLSYALGSRAPTPLLMIGVLLLTLAKGQMVADYFMGLRHVKRFWRLMMMSWLLIVGGAVALAYQIH